MKQRLSRRELIAWLAAGTGAATAGAVVLGGGRDGSSPPEGGTTQDVPESGPRVSGAPSTASAPPRRTGDERLLVVVELPGGNDGLSTAVPYGIGRYYDVRPSTAIAPDQVLPVDGTIGLHPNLAGLHERGVTLVHGVGSATPDGSHFEMLNRWWSGNSTAADVSTGWIGRLSDVLREGAPDASALALSIGSGDHPIIRSATGSTLSLPGLDALWAVAGADPGDDALGAYQAALRAFGAPVDGAGRRYRETIGATLDFAGRMLAEEVEQESDPETDGYTWGGLGQGLWLAAKLFAADVGTRVVHVPMDGDFDTHDGHTWRHPELLAELDAGLAAFHADLERRGLADRVLVATTSEFGRTLRENGSDGLDHGTASTMLLAGPVTGGQVGELPSLTALDENDDLVAAVPLESYLAGVVEQWLDVPATEIFPGAEPLPILT